ncbi:hypothetical protein CSUI_011287, partial [Cystoisospora suis]
QPCLFLRPLSSSPNSRNSSSSPPFPSSTSHPHTVSSSSSFLDPTVKHSNRENSQVISSLLHLSPPLSTSSSSSHSSSSSRPSSSSSSLHACRAHAVSPFSGLVSLSYPQQEADSSRFLQSKSFFSLSSHDLLQERKREENCIDLQLSNGRETQQEDRGSVRGVRNLNSSSSSSSSHDGRRKKEDLFMKKSTSGEKGKKKEGEKKERLSSMNKFDMYLSDFNQLSGVCTAPSSQSSQRQINNSSS